MLGKLLKYDFKIILKSIIPFFIITIFLGALTRVVLRISDSFAVLKPASALILFLFVLLVIGLPFIAFILTISNYYNKMIKDEGYLTHTLPVKKSSLIISKLIVSIVIILLAIVVMYISLVIGIDGFYKGFNQVANEICTSFNLLFLILMAASLLIGYISNLLMIFLAIAFGQKHYNKKGVYSFVYWFLIYNVSQIVSLILAFIPALFIKGYMEIFEEEIPKVNDLNLVFGYSLIISIVFTVIYYVMTEKIMSKNLNLD